MGKLVAFLCVLFLTGLLTDIALALSDNDILDRGCVNGITRTRKQYKRDQDSWNNCVINNQTLKRMNIINWIGKGFDMDGDEAISFEECQYTRKYYFNEAELIVGETCETVMQRCDCDGDGYITYEDFKRSDMSCLRDCDAGKRVWYFVGSRMTDPNKAFTGTKEPDRTIDKNVLNQ